MVSIGEFADAAVRFRTDSHPRAMCRMGNTIKLAPTPGGASTYTIWYYGRFDAVDAAKATSNVLKDGSQMLLYGAAYYGAMWMRDREGQQYYGEKFACGHQRFRPSCGPQGHGRRAASYPD